MYHFVLTTLVILIVLLVLRCCMIPGSRTTIILTDTVVQVLVARGEWGTAAPTLLNDLIVERAVNLASEVELGGFARNIETRSIVLYLF